MENQEPQTWRDLMGPDELQPETLTRPEFVERLRAEGIEVSPRTLAYWESEDILPRPVRQWRYGVHAIYPAWMVDIVRTVRGMQAAGMTLEQIRGAVLATPWHTPTAEDLVRRWDAYTAASEAISPQLSELAQARELATGTRIVDATVSFVTRGIA